MDAIHSLIEDLISGDEVRAESASGHLGQMGSPAITALEAVLGSPEADHRWWAVRALAQMPEVGTDHFMIPLGDVSAEVRQAAALALVAHPAEEAAPVLVRALSDNDALVQTLAANALSALGKPAVPFLLAAYPQATLSAKIHMMRVLADARDHRAIPLMMKAMDEDSAILHHWCEIGLQQLGLDMVYLQLS